MKRGLVIPVALAALGLGLFQPPPCRGEGQATLGLANTYIYDTAPARKPATPPKPVAARASKAVRPAAISSPAVRNQPASAPAAVVPGAGAVSLASPGDLVVGPGAAAPPSVRAASAAAPARPAPKTFPLGAALMALVGLAPALGWVWFGRSRPRKARSRAWAPDKPPSPAAPRLRVLRRAAEPDEAPEAPAEPVAPRAIADPGPDVAPRGLEQLRASARRVVSAVKAAPPDPGPAAAAPASAPPAGEIESLRAEVLEGLREMKRRTAEFTDALEAGRSELQSELARARRALDLLRAERIRMEEAVRRAPAESPAAAERDEAPEVRPGARAALDPEWIRLADETDGLVVPSTVLHGRRAPQKAFRADAGAPVGAAAVRALAARSGPSAVIHGRSVAGTTTRVDRRRQITTLAREGHTIEQIARDLGVGRGEVALALAKAV